MTGKTVKAAGLLLAFGLTAGFAAAQPGPGAGPRAREIRRNLHTLRLVRMTEALELSDEQTARIFPVLNRVEKEKAGLQQRISDQVRELRARLEKSGAGDEAELLAAVRAVRGLREDVARKDAELEAFLDAELSPVQKARYILFSVDFYRRLGERLERLRTPAGQGRGRGE
jgi:Spy/CpxP family protein refolding chaperone